MPDKLLRPSELRIGDRVKIDRITNAPYLSGHELIMLNCNTAHNYAEIELRRADNKPFKLNMSVGESPIIWSSLVSVLHIKDEPCFELIERGSNG